MLSSRYNLAVRHDAAARHNIVVRRTIAIRDDSAARLYIAVRETHRMMQARKERKAAGRHFRVRWPYVILAFLMILFAVKFVQKTRELQDLTRQTAALRFANQQTIAQNRQLGRDIKYYRTDSYIRTRARSTLGYTFPGEVAVDIGPPPAVKVKKAPQIIRHIAPPEPAWQQWLNAFSL